MEEIPLHGENSKKFLPQGGISPPKEAWGESSAVASGGLKMSVPKLDLGGGDNGHGHTPGGNMSRGGTARGGTMGVGAEALILPTEGGSHVILHTLVDTLSVTY